MAFEGPSAMDERVRFCVLFESGEASMSELCRQFGVSRKSGYAVLARWRALGSAGLAERSHAPKQCPHALDAVRSEAILALRRRHPTWGPKKLKAWLETHHPGTTWPAASTIGELLARAGLSVPRRRRRHAAPRSAPLAHCREPNDVWSMDFKGWFLTGDGACCEPLTVQDQASRYLLRVVDLAKLDSAHVWPVLAAAFREFGLPWAIRSDNGPPFASTGAGGLSALSVRLIKAGVAPDRTDPASPEQNGRLERLHLTLRQDTASPPAATLARQAARLRAWQKVYNEERPHEALGQQVPASVYARSPRLWSGRLSSPEYGADCQVRRNGEIKWQGSLVYVSQALVGEPVAVEESEDGRFDVRYGPVALGRIGDKGRLVPPLAVPAHGRRRDASPSGHSVSLEAKSVTHHAG